MRRREKLERRHLLIGGNNLLHFKEVYLIVMPIRERI